MFSQTGEYALRAASHIAQHGTNNPVLAKDIAERTRVPLKYLQKVLRTLVRSGILTSARGIGGGFQLTRRPDEVTLIQVLEPFDNMLERTTCPFGNTQCGFANPCPLHDRWGKVVTVYEDFLENTTLADITWPS